MMASVLKGVNKAWNSNANMKAGTMQLLKTTIYIINIVAKIFLSLHYRCPNNFYFYFVSWIDYF